MAIVIRYLKYLKAVDASLFRFAFVFRCLAWKILFNRKDLFLYHIVLCSVVILQGEIKCLLLLEGLQG